jgi:hypothetical protein
VPEMCHEGKTMHRSVVSQVNSIWSDKSVRTSTNRQINMRSCCTWVHRRPCRACRGPCVRGPCVNDPLSTILCCGDESWYLAGVRETWELCLPSRDRRVEELHVMARVAPVIDAMHARAAVPRGREAPHLSLDPGRLHSRLYISKQPRRTSCEDLRDNIDSCCGR